MELEYYQVDGEYGWDQEKFTDPVMKKGGCGAVTACDSCIYFSKYYGKKELYPFDPNNVTSRDYKAFAKMMKPFLGPRMRGIDSLDIYLEGIRGYFKSVGCDYIETSGFSGHEPYEKAEKTVAAQIDAGYPIPCLTLMHTDRRFKDYSWHWFMITGYKKAEDKFMIKVVSYGEWVWLDFKALWDTGYDEKGGLIIFKFRDSDAH